MDIPDILEIIVSEFKENLNDAEIGFKYDIVPKESIFVVTPPDEIIAGLLGCDHGCEPGVRTRHGAGRLASGNGQQRGQGDDLQEREQTHPVTVDFRGARSRHPAMDYRSVP